MRTPSHTRSIVRSLTRSLPTAGAALAAAAVLASPAAAQGRYGRGGYGNGGYGNGGNGGNGGYGGYGRTADGARPLYVWRGRVDREAFVVMQNGDVRTRMDGYDNGSGGRLRVASALPQVDGVIDVQLQEGRGRVDVVEQPTSRNGYRAVVRVRDDDAGAGNYRFVTTWRPTGGGYADGGYDGRQRDRNRDDDGRDDRRGRDRDGTYGNNGGGYGNGGGGYGTGSGTYGGSGALHWRGRVDDVEDIRLQGGRVETRTVSGQGAAGVRSQLSGAALPASDVTVRVNDRSGRGRVTVVQQPHAWNGYTAVVRVEDRDPGAAWHDFDVTW